VTVMSNSIVARILVILVIAFLVLSLVATALPGPVPA
jgi:hypothetical protein